MKRISSRDNAVYRRFTRAIAGRIPGCAVLEGIHVCQAWLDHAGAPQQALFDAERLRQGGELARLAAALGSDIGVECEPALMRQLSQVPSGQGVCFMIASPEPRMPDSIDRNCLWLDRIQDPGNLGTLLRTAAAAGIGQVYLSTGTALAWSQKVLRSAQGAHFALSIYERVDLSEACGKLAIPLVATTLEGGDSLYAAELPRHCAWLLGNEGQGVAPALLARADRRVFVPQAEGVESLNVAAAAAICLFEQRRQRLAHG